MNRFSPLMASVVLLIGGTALAIPPPWTLEEGKAQADLVLIAKMTKAESVENIQGANARIGFVPIEVLKGDLGPKDFKKKDASLFLLFTKQEDRPGPDGIQRRMIGGTGDPKPVDGQTALIFLKKDHTQRNSYRAVYGSFGYLGLSATAGQDLAGLSKRIDMHRQWCAKIGSEDARKAMESYYDKAKALLAEKTGPKEP
jgi:hypothetical protein